MISASVPHAAPGAVGIDPSQLPHVWRACELARAREPVAASGHAELDAQLPGGGWPRGALVELLLRQPGIGEMQLLKPILAQLSAQRRVALVQPPYVPQASAAASWGINASSLLWLRPKVTADALWCTEQLLKAGTCGAVVLWQQAIRLESLRRLHLAAQSTETWFWLIRPLSCATEPSPAVLRLGLKPAHGGIAVDVLKRRGPQCEAELIIPLGDMPDRRIDHDNHAPPIQPVPAVFAAGSTAPVLV